LLQTMKDLTLKKAVAKPVLLKIAPDLSTGQLDDIIEILNVTGMDGVIATNTTISREGLETESSELARIGQGGLSGKPLGKRSTEIIRYLRSKLGKDFPIIGAGGIMSPADALEKLQAGADLIQLYTGFIYEGPGLIKRINKGIVKYL
jgi:dihydroorotate dehydrogenase